MPTSRRWQTRPSPGQMINHPAVLAEAQRDYDGVRPQKRVVDGLTIVTYSRPRVYLDREAWEMLPAEGVLLMRVRPTGGKKFALAFTSQELEQTFGEVRKTESWDAGCYHFPTEPPAARAFLVGSASPDRNTPARSVPTPITLTSRPATAKSAQPATKPDASVGFDEWAAWWYARLGARPESAEYLAAVSAWRNAWRPSQVRGVLLAESHVAERQNDSGIRVRANISGISGLPAQYVRLVYCLGYGESDICSRTPIKNSGTVQYWDILGQVARRQNQPRKSVSTLSDRLRWKVTVLRELQARGIWLQDASPLGLYLGSGARISPRLQSELMRDGYTRWVWPSVKEDRPEKVWVIGSGVLSTLKGLPGIDRERMIIQPQGDRNQPGRHLEGLLRMAADLNSLTQNQISA
jgi:hypothetical protein